uniref:MARVEL domain-containing protein n=1 Tax=Bactrocera dorsalis TaxID=27457 RepID=A0A034WL38_BACDO
MPLNLTHLQRCIISTAFYVVCFILEIVACALIIDMTDSDCIGAREISTFMWWSGILVFIPIIPDILYCIMGILISEPFYAALGGCYNIVMFFVCVLACIFAFLSVTGCGNPKQTTVLAVGVIELIAGIVHLVFIWFIKENLDEGEVLFSKNF